MKVTTGLLCDFAQARDGLLYVMSGGITRLWRPSVPAPLGIFYAIVLELDQVEMERPHEFLVIVMNEDGDRVVEVGGGFQVNAADLHVGERQQVPLAIDFRQGEITTWGAHSVSFYVDGNSAHETAFYVMDQAEQSPDS